MFIDNRNNDSNKQKRIAKTILFLISFIVLISSLFVFSSGMAYGDELINVKDGNEGEISPYNPYSKNCTINVQIGSEFATYSISDISEGYIYKLAGTETDVILPKLRAKDGYIFVGWSQGGVVEPTWDALTEVVSIPESEEAPTVSRSANIYALFADEEGNGYCTCGAYKEGFYKDNLETYKAAYQQYLDYNYGKNYLATIIIVVIFCGIFIGMIARIELDNTRKHKKTIQQENKE